MAGIYKCPHCAQVIKDPPYGSHFSCPHCAETIYFSHCWRCSTLIAGTKDNKCPKCGWHHCDNCTSCSPDCEEHKPGPPIGTISFVSDADAFGTEPDESDDDVPDDDEMTLRDLEDETPDACWEEWRDSDPSAYTGDECD